MYSNKNNKNNKLVSSDYMYKVTAIVSTYNSELFFEGCMENLINQTIYKKDELQVVVIDSASQEMESEIAKGYINNYDHIVYQRTEDRESLYKAWNRGLSIARGKYLTNANTDDRHHPAALERLANVLDYNPDVGLAYGDCLITEKINETFIANTAKNAYVFPQCSIKQALARQFFGPQPMWRSSVHETIGYFDSNLSIQGDYDFFIRLAWKFGGIHFPELLGLYCRRSDSVERADRCKNIQEQAIVKNYYRSLIPIRDIYPALNLYPDSEETLAICHIDLGNLFFQAGGDTKNARANYLQSIKICPSIAPVARHNLALCDLFDKKFKTSNANPYTSRAVPIEYSNELARIEHDVLSIDPKVIIGPLEHSMEVAKKLQKEEREKNNFFKHKRSLRSFCFAAKDLMSAHYDSAEQHMVYYKTGIDYEAFSKWDRRRSALPSISVIIPAFRTGKALLECLDSLEHQSVDDFEVIVVDNGGNNCVHKEILSRNLLLIKTTVNVFPSEARNIGSFFARGDILAFLDDDGIAHPEFIKSIFVAFSSNSVKALRGKVLPKSKNPYGEQHATHYNLGEKIIRHYIGTEGCSAILSDAYKNVNGMNPLLFGAEGLEISYRLSKLYGMDSIIYSPKTIIYHDYANSEYKLQNKIDRHKNIHEYLANREPEVLNYMHGIRNEYDSLCRNTIRHPLNNDNLKSLLNIIGWNKKFEKYSDFFELCKVLKIIQSPSISIIVISWRYNPDTLKNFQALNAQRNQNFELIFVDNGGKPGEFDKLKPYIDTYVRLNTNTGAYLARNVGAVFAQAPILLFLDDDAISADDFVKAHLDVHGQFDVHAVRGVCLPKTDNPLNSMARHYYLGDKPYPRFGDLEGNISYKAESFFRIGGWDDEIIFGHGGIDLCYRLLQVDPDMRKHVYHPGPMIHHDYLVDEQHFAEKREKQSRSWDYLRRKHGTAIDNFLACWDKFIGAERALLTRETKQPEKGQSLKNLAEYYRRKGKIDKADAYLRMAESKNSP